MAVITKFTEKGSGSQTFTNSDASTGDIIDILGSLGRHARQAVIYASASSNLTVRRNVRKEVFSRRKENDGLGTHADAPADNLADKTIFIDGNQAQQVIGKSAARSVTINGPLKDLEVTWSTGTWEITFS